MSRPKGSKNTQDTATTIPSRCTHCQSTDATKIGHRLLQPFAGTDSNGKPFTAICRQRVKCANCGQMRIDRSLIFPGEPLDFP